MLSRVTYSILFLAFAIVLTTSLIFLLYIEKSLRTQFNSEIKHLLDVASSDLTAALTFDDHKAIQKILISLEKTYFIKQIVVYNSERNPLVIIGKLNSNIPTKLEKKIEFNNNSFIAETTRKFYLNQGLLGSIVLYIDSFELWRSVVNAIAITCALSCILLLLSYLVASYFLKQLLSPLLQLSVDMTQVAYKKDYSFRAHSIPNTRESHVLIDGFNTMLSEIQARDHSLEAIVNQRTLQLYQALQDAQSAQVLAESGSKSKSEFLASMSHEIRTPLNGISTLTELMLGTTLTPPQREDLLSIRMCLINLRGIIDSILDLSKIEAGKLYIDENIFNLEVSLTNPIDLLRKQALYKNIVFTYIFSKDISDYCKGDALRIIQIVNNLAGNAIKFTKPGQTVEIRVGKESKEDENTFNCWIEVEDTGVGMTPEEQRHIFEPFSQADSSTTQKYGGTGLGLTIVHKLVDLMGGTIFITSAKGVGTLARVVFPLKKLEFGSAEQTINKIEKSSQVLIHHQEVVSTLSGMVLFIDDHEVNLKSITRILEMAGLSVVSATNGEDALNLFSMLGTFDIVLTDLRMPIMDGFEMSRKIREIENEYTSDRDLIVESGNNSGRIPIIALTADLTDTIRKRCEDAGIDDVLFKPINVNQLIKRISDFLIKR